MNNTTFFSGLAEQSVHNVIVRNPDWRVPYRACTNRCKALGHVNMSSILEYSPVAVEECMEDCQHIIPTSHWECQDRQCCHQHARDNDTDFVKCMQDNRLPYDFKTDRGIIHANTATPIPPHNDTTIADDFVVMEDRTFFPEASLFSCRDTVRGQCDRNVSLTQCVENCRNSPFCQFGYFLELQPSGETFCLPLREKDEFHHQDMTQYTLPTSQLKLGDTVRAKTFYRKALDFENDIFVPTTLNPFVLEQDGRYVNRQLGMGETTEALLFKFKNIQYKVNVMENNSLNVIVMYETLNSLVYNKQTHAFEFLQLVQVSQIERLSFDTSIYATTFQIMSTDTEDLFLRDKARIRIAMVDRSTVDNQKLGYVCIQDGKLSLQPESNAKNGVFQIHFRQLPPFQLPLQDVQQYYQRFWKQLPVEEAPRHYPWWLIVLVCAIALIAIAAGLWIGRSKR